MLTLRCPLQRKVRMRWFFDISTEKESRFFKSDLNDPHQIFNAHLLETTDLSPSRFHFSTGFIPRSWFESDDFIAYSNGWDWRGKERYLFFAELAMSQGWSALLCATGAWGGKPIGRVRIKLIFLTTNNLNLKWGKLKWILNYEINIVTFFNSEKPRNGLLESRSWSIQPFQTSNLSLFSLFRKVIAQKLKFSNKILI